MAEPIYITMSNTPQNIIHVMDGLVSHRNEQDKRLQYYHHTLETYAQPIRQRFWLCWALVVVGGMLFVLEHILALHGGIVAYTALFCWVAALATATFLVATLSPRRGFWRWVPWGAIVLAVIGTLLFLTNGTTSEFAGFVQIAGGIAVGAMLLTRHTGTRTYTSKGRAKRIPPPKEFPPHYHTAREVISTLRDDIAPKTNIIGHLDLTGAQQKEKLMRQSTNTQGRSVHYYRNEWLSIKSKLYDGSLLRLSLLENVKERLSYTKRSRSGKRKTKPAKFQNSQEINVRITANPHLYNVTGTAPVKLGTRIGTYSITNMQVDGTTLSVKATAPQTTIGPRDILGVLQFAYSHLHRKDAP